MTNKEVMQQALDALESWQKTCLDCARPSDELGRATKPLQALRTALAQPEQEPVAWISAEETWLAPRLVISETPKERYKPVYTAPPQRELVGLTRDEVEQWELPFFPTVYEFAQFVEAKLKEKNT